MASSKSEGSASQYFQTSVTTPTLYQSIQGLSYVIYGTILEKTDAKVCTASENTKEATMDRDVIQAHKMKIKLASVSAFQWR